MAKKATKKGPGRPKGQKNKPGHRAGRPPKSRTKMKRVRAARMAFNTELTKKLNTAKVPTKGRSQRVIFEGTMKIK
jgi:hypothetical protein